MFLATNDHFKKKNFDFEVLSSHLCIVSISQTVIYNAHHKKNIISGNPLPSKAGKHIKMKISDEKKKFSDRTHQFIPKS
jgi:hypothetical protein